MARGFVVGVAVLLLGGTVTADKPRVTSYRATRTDVEGQSSCGGDPVAGFRVELGERARIEFGGAPWTPSADIEVVTMPGGRTGVRARWYSDDNTSGLSLIVTDGMATVLRTMSTTAGDIKCADMFVGTPRKRKH